MLEIGFELSTTLGLIALVIMGIRNRRQVERLAAESRIAMKDRYEIMQSLRSIQVVLHKEFEADIVKDLIKVHVDLYKAGGSLESPGLNSIPIIVPAGFYKHYSDEQMFAWMNLSKHGSDVLDDTILSYQSDTEEQFNEE